VPLRTGPQLEHVAFPLGGLGAGMICLEGSGGLARHSLRHRPALDATPLMFAALCVAGEARVLEGPVPHRRVARGRGAGRSIGLPRFREATFEGRFPSARVVLREGRLPLDVELVAWSPFVPGDPEACSLPVAALTYRFHNPGAVPVDGVFSFHSEHVLVAETPERSVRPVQRGFVLQQAGSDERPWDRGALAVVLPDEDRVVSDCAWFRGGWSDGRAMLWRGVVAGRVEARGPRAEGDPSPGASLALPIQVPPGGTREVRVLVAWHVPVSDLVVVPFRGSEPADLGPKCCGDTTPSYVPWYAGRFADIDALLDHWRAQGPTLEARSLAFGEALHRSTLPEDLLDAVSRNLSILKSPTVLRQADGRLWAWEGVEPDHGCCAGTCTHVFNYAQAVAHLLPELERGLREDELSEGLRSDGQGVFRLPLPIRVGDLPFRPAADGQLGTLVRVHREWRLQGDLDWVRGLWPALVRSLEFCIRTWDPGEVGLLTEPHHNTYDIRFFGPDPCCCGVYLTALRAMVELGGALGEDVGRYRELADRAREAIEDELFDGDHFVQRVRWTPGTESDEHDEVAYSPEARALLAQEGPRYQVGQGVHADALLGEWLALCSGLAPGLEAVRVRSHLAAVLEHNGRDDLLDHANPLRPWIAIGDEGGLLLCTWPQGDAPSLPFPYAHEVWTGIEYQVACHALRLGLVDEALEAVGRVRARYDGTRRNPFEELECGSFYARALSSYSLLQGWTGVRYDAVTRTLFLDPVLEGDFEVFLSTATGWGTVGLRGGEPFVDFVEGTLEVERYVVRPASQGNESPSHGNGPAAPGR